MRPPVEAPAGGRGALRCRPVLASYGHVRDLPPRDGSVQPDAGFSMSWELSAGAGPRLAEIEAAAAGSPLLLLATDPDREGEAISWHIEEELRRRGVLRKVGAVQRITFTEITKSAITAALAKGRQVSQPLVDAYLARRALDYLVGFHLSPVLWRKLPGARSAGRVQSVALRLVCEREAAIERFSPTPYWSLAAALEPPAPAGRGQGQPGAGAAFTAKLTHVDGRRLGQLAIGSEEQAAELAQRLREGAVLRSRSVVATPHATRPPPRFTEASLVRALEERGIGRPSTYAPIMSLLQDRGYVCREGRSLLPTSLGRVLTAFLERYFGGVVDYTFTSDLEAQLDDVAGGKAAWRLVLSSFWSPFQTAVAAMAAIRTTQVFDALDADLEYFLFPRRPDQSASPAAALPPAAADGAAIDVVATEVPRPTPSAPPVADADAGAGPASSSSLSALHDPRVCPKCGRGRLVLKPSRFGGFIGCSLYADEQVRCDYGRPLLPVMQDGSDAAEGGAASPVSAAATERLLGQHPETGEPVYVKLGPYGLYVQQGEAAKEPAAPAKKKKAAAKKATKKTRAGKGKKAAGEEGASEEEERAGGAEAGEAEAEAPAEAGVAPGKPKRASIPKAKGLTLSSVSLEAALALLALPRTLGAHPGDGQPVVASTGPFGPYVAHGGVSASLGRRATPQEVDLALALELLDAKRRRQAEREAKGLPPRGGRRTPAAKGKAAKPTKPAKPAKAEGKKVAKAEAAEGPGPAAAGSKQPPPAPSAYTLFMRRRWQAAKEADPGASYREEVSRIAAEWRGLGAEGQRRFGEEAAAAAAEAEEADVGAEASDKERQEAVPAPKRRAASAASGATASSGGGGGGGARKKAAAVTVSASRSRKAAAASAAAGSAAGGAATATAAAAAAGTKPRSNPFMAFCAERRPALKATHPGAGMAEMGRLLGAAWKELSDQEKAAYR
ncbi:hypothetical protein GPECTOR_96g713 [Gonium pectorale]|uniref:DNA topoisomerase n=1 Tax=Gonium pectorale TaxID=33097 RepID=A0A150G082_GONPE|nr:hypothetical protein GPECTOR_96g713 [Gonium pectorale]|eukprot:KXZ43247.1 hypothetical protein GPECTOR_96g713 [Gonium pectorale]